MNSHSIIVQAYAKALFGNDRSDSDLLKYRNALLTLKNALVDDNFKAIVANKAFDRSQILSIIKELVKAYSDSILDNFCNIIVQNGVLFYITEVSEEFDKLLEQKNNEVCVVMEYASIPTQEIQKSHEQFLSNKFNKKIIAKLVINPDLLAGVKFTVGDLVIDASLKSRINQLAASLMV